MIKKIDSTHISSSNSDIVGELINNTAILEINPTNKKTCATFRNMVSIARKSLILNQKILK